MQLYIVKLAKPEEHPKFQQREGFLAWEGEKVITYTKGQALKKARLFGGKVIPILIM